MQRRLFLLFVLLAFTACAPDDGGGIDGDIPVYRPDGDQTPSDGDDPPVDGDDPHVDGDDPPVDGDDPHVDGDDPPVDGDDPPVDGDDPPVDGDDPHADGDAESETPAEPYPYCEALDACPPDSVCNFALMRCEPRTSVLSWNARFFAFHPPAATSGDMLVIDGQAFYASLGANMQVAAWIGDKQFPFFALSGTDENRLLITVPSGTSGKIRVQCEGGIVLESRESFTQTPPGVIACGGEDFMATGDSAFAPTALGPFAPGYLDLIDNDGQARLFYPASCAGLRRPGIPGSYPLVAILHGNGAVYINYEYLGQLLASRGFVVINPASGHTNEYDPDVIDALYEHIDRVRDTSLEALHPSLAAMSSGADLLMIGHSRGCGRMQEMLADYPALAADTLGAVFLGPANLNDVVPGAFLVIGATEDGQSFTWNYNAQYERQPAPKWKVIVEGGNHSLFGDAKVYYGFDGAPRVTRQRQLSIVSSFVIPFVERAFGMDEPHADWLDDPPVSPDYSFASQVQ